MSFFLLTMLRAPRIYDWSVFADQNYFLTKEFNFEDTTTGCWHHPKFQGQVPKESA